MTQAATVRARQELLQQEVLEGAPVRLGFVARHFAAVVSSFQLLLDLATAFGALLLSYATYRHLGLGEHVSYQLESYALVSAAVAVGFVLLLDRYDLYRPSGSLLNVRETEAILRSTCWSMAAFLVLGYLVTRFAPSRWILGIASGLVFGLVLAERALYYVLLRRMHVRGYGIDRALLYGCSEAGIQLFRKLMVSPRSGLVAVAFVDDDPALLGRRIYESSYTRRGSVSVVGTGQDLENVIRRLGITRLILTLGKSEQASEFKRISQVCSDLGVEVSFVPLHYGVELHQLEYRNLDGVMLADVRAPRESPVYAVAKRILDLLLGSLALLLLAPAMAAAALAIWLETGGPVLFVHQRVGQDGALFRMFKFRSMHQDTCADAHTPSDVRDPRITRVGRFLRRTSFDELPQLFNVLRGEMSLVGPRPEMPFIVARYTAAQRERLRAKPGITGLWQISADRAYEIHENIDYDLYYIRNRSVVLDIVILIHTVFFAIRGVGAF